MRPLRPRIQFPRDKLEEFCRWNHIVKLALFGPVLREDFGPGDAVNVLVEFEAGQVPAFFKLFELEWELSSLAGGRKVEIRTPDDLNRYLRQQVLSTAVVQYATG